LQTQKAEVADMVVELERKGRELAQRHETVQFQKGEFQSLPDKIEGLDATIEQLRTSHPSPAKIASHLSLPLPATKELLSEREAEVAALDAQLASLQAQLPPKARELVRLESELKPLELQKMGTVAAAKEARRRKEEGSGVDDLETKGRWYRAADTTLRNMLGVEG